MQENTGLILGSKIPCIENGNSHSVILSWETDGQKSLGRLSSPWVTKRRDTTEQVSTHTHQVNHVFSAPWSGSEDSFKLSLDT